jgi:4-hydroxy-4-methyl-2-oxoglutarate aldolase
MQTKALIRRFQEFSAATVYEANGKFGDLEPTIRPVVPGLRMVGTAFTVKCFVGDAKAVALAIDQAQEGDVLVIDAGGTQRATPWGSMSATAAKLRGIAGCVTNGAVRDMDELIEIGFPVFAAGVSVRGNVKLHPGWIGIPVSVGGMTVRPGDIVIGDSDGVVIVAAEQAQAVFERVVDQQAKENEIMQRIRSGEPLGRIFELS